MFSRAAADGETARRDLPHAFLERALEVAPARNDTDVELLGPAWAPMERRAGHYRAQLMLHAASHSQPRAIPKMRRPSATA